MTNATAEELAYQICGDNSMITKQVIKALRTYGQSIRDRDAEICKSDASKHRDTAKDLSSERDRLRMDDAAYALDSVATAIKAERLP